MDVVIKVPHGAERLAVLGSADRNLKMIREALGVQIASRDTTVRISGPRRAVFAAKEVLEQLSTGESDPAPSRQQVLDLINQAIDRTDDAGSDPTEALNGQGGFDGSAEGPAWTDHLDVYAAGHPVRARTPNQQGYLDAIRDHDLVFGIGPAGTGKTYLAVAAAVHLLKAGRVKKVILARPAVEAGERLGFLPGDLQAKVNPYLRPLLDALHDMMDFGTIKRFMMSDVVEVVPLAYMRGRTLNRAAIILDEAQNSTRGQMKMFLTRMGHGSKMIVTGDTTQIDLPDPRDSGLVDAAKVLRRVSGVAFTTFTEQDIVRNPLVARVVEAYGRSEKPKGASPRPRTSMGTASSPSGDPAPAAGV